MKCPYCNEEMELGYLQSARTISWSPKKHKFIFIPNEKKGELYMPTEGWDSYVESYLCRKCNIVISPLKK
ncbi:MAG: PF20097 family protein [Anaerotignaceae bacterium]